MNWLECCECLKRINPGETCWSVNVHMETPGEGGAIEVIEATGVLVSAKPARVCEILIKSSCHSSKERTQLVLRLGIVKRNKRRSKIKGRLRTCVLPAWPGRRVAGQCSNESDCP